MATMRSIELAEQADRLDEQGKFEQAAEVRHLASFGADAQDVLESRERTSTRATPGELASEAEETDVEWVWPNWIPRQYVGLLGGDSKTGKSRLVRYLASALTSGGEGVLPDGQ